MNPTHIRRGLSRVAWGYLLLLLNFNLGTLNLLPDWGAYLCFLSAIALLAGELRDLPLLRPFCLLLAGAEGVDWLAVLFTGQALTPRLFPLSALLTCVALYTLFQLLTDLAMLADRLGSGLGGRLQGCRNVDAVLRALFSLPPLLGKEGSSALYLLLFAAWLLICLVLLVTLFQLRKCVPEEDAQPRES